MWQLHVSDCWSCREVFSVVKALTNSVGVLSQEFARAHDHLTHFLTYADNNAVGYFAKQGFTKEITLEKDRVSIPCILPSCCSFGQDC